MAFQSLSNHLRTGLFASGIVLSAASGLLPTDAKAGSISPSSFSKTIGVGDTVEVIKTVVTDAGSNLIDFLFLADNTGSMGGVIGNVQSVANALLTSLSTTYSGAQFAVARYLGDPTEGDGFDGAYDVLQASTSSLAAVTTGIGSWFASGGGDYPEANFYALHQAVTNGASTCPGLGTTPGNCGGSGESLGWRAGARKVLLWFGDAPSHTETVTLDNAVATLSKASAAVVAFNSTGAGGGLDDTYGADPRQQATSVCSALGSSNCSVVQDFASVPVDDLVTTIDGVIGEVTSTIDLSLAVVSGDTSGLDVDFVCTDPAGCNDVPLGDARQITMRVAGVTPGTYAYTVAAPGVAGAVEDDRITVRGSSDVPGPLPVLGIAAALAHARRLKRRLRPAAAL